MTEKIVWSFKQCVLLWGDAIGGPSSLIDDADKIASFVRWATPEKIPDCFSWLYLRATLTFKENRVFLSNGRHSPRERYKSKTLLLAYSLDSDSETAVVVSTECDDSRIRRIYHLSAGVSPLRRIGIASESDDGKRVRYGSITNGKIVRDYVSREIKAERA